MDELERVVVVPMSFLKPDKVDRRERIATALLTGVVAHPDYGGFSAEDVREAVVWADALIAELDKPKGER